MEVDGTGTVRGSDGAAQDVVPVLAGGAEPLDGRMAREHEDPGWTWDRASRRCTMPLRMSSPSFSGVATRTWNDRAACLLRKRAPGQIAAAAPDPNRHFGHLLRPRFGRGPAAVALEPGAHRLPLGVTGIRVHLHPLREGALPDVLPTREEDRLPLEGDRVTEEASGGGERKTGLSAGRRFPPGLVRWPKVFNFGRATGESLVLQDYPLSVLAEANAGSLLPARRVLEAPTAHHDVGCLGPDLDSDPGLVPAGVAERAILDAVAVTLDPGSG